MSRRPLPRHGSPGAARHGRVDRVRLWVTACSADLAGQGSEIDDDDHGGDDQDREDDERREVECYLAGSCT